MIRSIYDYYTKYGQKKVTLKHSKDVTVTSLVLEYDRDFGLFSIAYIQDGELNTKVKTTAQVFHALNNKVWEIKD